MKTLSVCSIAVLLSSAVIADPTRPPPGWQEHAGSNSAVVSAAAPRLQLIKQTAHGRVAVIDGELVRKGERYRQYLVLEIQDAQVVVELNGHRQVLPLLNTAIKQYEK
jgi:hypothetical protein